MNLEVKKYFVYDYLNDGFHFFDEKSEAMLYLKDLVRDYTIEGEHQDDIDGIYTGEVTHFGLKQLEQENGK